MTSNLNKIADALLAGETINFMSISSPQDLQKILEDRGVDIINQAYINEGGNLAVVDNLDSIWLPNQSVGTPLSLSQKFTDTVNQAANTAALVNTYNLSQNDLVLVDTMVNDLHDSIQSDFSQLRTKIYSNDIYQNIIDTESSSHVTTVTGFINNLNYQKDSIATQLNNALNEFPESYREAVIREQTEYFETSMSELYDLLQPYANKIEEQENTQPTEPAKQAPSSTLNKNSWESLYEM